MRHIAKQSIEIAMCLFFVLTANAQIYNPESKKVVVGQLGEIIWKDGIHNKCDARFGTLVVKERRNSISPSRQIGIPVIYIKPTQEDSNGLPVFVFGGGPGESNLANTMFFENVISKNPIVMIGYRGADGNTRLDCPCLLNAINDTSINEQNATDTYKSAIDSCINNWHSQIIDIQGYSISEMANDIEDVRLALGIDKFNVVAFSFGTMLTQMYEQLFPGHIVRNVMIAPRLLYDFEIHSDDIATLDMQINRLLDPKTDFIIRNFIDNRENIGVNSEKFMLYTYMKLYSVDGIKELMEIPAKCDNYCSLKKEIDIFLNTFSGKIATGDIVAKRANNPTIHISKPDKPNGYEPMAKSANNWFNSINQDKSDIYAPTANDISTLIICGDLDIVAPTEKTCQQLSEIFRNSKAITIHNAGHADLLGFQREKTEKAIIDFIME